MLLVKQLVMTVLEMSVKGSKEILVSGISNLFWRHEVCLMSCASVTMPGAQARKESTSTFPRVFFDVNVTKNLLYILLPDKKLN